MSLKEQRVLGNFFFLLATYERTFSTHFHSKGVPFHLSYEQYR